MSIFAPTRSHRGPSREYMAQRRMAGRATLRAFAEALANGSSSIAQASRDIGISQQRGSQLFRQIRIELGDQAR